MSSIIILEYKCHRCGEIIFKNSMHSSIEAAIDLDSREINHGNCNSVGSKGNGIANLIGITTRDPGKWVVE